MERKFRRVVTGHNSEGKSIILMDGVPPQVLEPLPQLFCTKSGKLLLLQIIPDIRIRQYAPLELSLMIRLGQYSLCRVSS